MLYSPFLGPTRFPLWIDWLVAGVLLFVFTWWNCFAGVGIAESVDYRIIYRPQFDFAFNSIRLGEIPWWNPYLGLGRPLMTDVHYGLWYPPTYLLVLLGETVGLFIMIWLHFLLLWAGVRQLVLHWNGRREWAFIAGLVVCLTGNFNGRLLSGMLYYVFEECYAPWILLFTARLAANWNWRLVLSLTLTTSAAFLCGNGHVFWLLLCPTGLFLLVRTFLDCRTGGWRAIAWPMGQWWTAIFIAAGLCAFAWLPYLDLIAEGNRHAPSYQFSAFSSANWRTMYSLVQGVSPEPAIMWEHNFFVGTFWFLSGLVGFLALSDRSIRALGAMTLFAALFALGSNSPIHELCYHFLPGTSLFRVPPRIMLWPSVTLIVVGAAWMSRMRNGYSTTRWLILTLLIPSACYMALAPLDFPELPPVTKSAWILGLAATVLLILSVCFASRWSGCLSIGLTIVALMVEFGPFTVYIQRVYLNEISHTYTREPGNREKANRLLNELREQAEKRTGQLPPARLNISTETLAPNAVMQADTASINADTPLFLRRPWLFLHTVGGVSQDPWFNHTLPLPITEFSPIELPYISFALDYDQAGDCIRPIPPTFPRAYFTSRIVAATNTTDAMAAIMAGIPVGQVAIVEGPTLNHITNSANHAPVDVEYAEYTHNRIKLNLTNSLPGYVVLNENWFPGWSVRRDGIEYETEPVNVWMRGAFVPSGNAPVEFVFRPHRLAWGISISVGFFVLVGLVEWRLNRKGPDDE
jgi:hypothetical protein